MKTSIKETALFTMSLIIAAILAASFTSCSQEEDAKPEFKKDTYTIIASETSSIATGLYDGDYIGDVKTASQYLGSGEIVAPGSTVSVSVAKGKTLFVKVDAAKPFDLVINKNGNEVMSLVKTPGGSILIFSNK